MRAVLEKGNVYDVRGLSSEKGAAIGKVPNGSTYLEIDTGKLYIYNGTGKVWVELGAGGGSSSGEGGVHVPTGSLPDNAYYVTPDGSSYRYDSTTDSWEYDPTFTVGAGDLEEEDFGSTSESNYEEGEL